MDGIALNAASTSSKIVMAVDDAAQNVLLLKSVNGSAGYTFVGAKSGSECMTLLTRVAPRLLLLDIEMPGMNGFETCRSIRAISELRQVPIAFLTARQTAEDVKAGLQAGSNDFIVKPFDVAKLLDRVRHWTTRRLCIA
jgi:CheY-like chemotaxis protein